MTGVGGFPADGKIIGIDFVGGDMEYGVGGEYYDWANLSVFDQPAYWGDLIISDSTIGSNTMVKKPVMPDGILGLQVCPNPFNPATEIEYQWPGAEQVTLIIYDAAGYEIKTLVRGFQQPGRQSITWDARDVSGNTVAGGVYLLRLTAGDKVMTKRMMMMK